MRGRRYEQGGFSLIELVIVVGLLGVLFAIGLPATSGYLRSSSLAGASSTLVADFRYARSLANSERRTYEILFTPNAYELRRLSPAATIRTRTLPRGVTFTASDTAVFYAWGLTDPITIELDNGRNKNVLRLSANGSVARD